MIEKATLRERSEREGDVVDAYVRYCSQNGVAPPTAPVQAALRNIGVVRNATVTTESMAEINRIRFGIEEMYGDSDPMGYGDKFDAFCKQRGRVRPTPEQIESLNRDSYYGSQAIRKDAGNPLLYRALVTFMSRGGGRNVRRM